VARIERVSLVAPMLNEARYVERFVADVAAQDFEGALELLVADGGSKDGSVERLHEAAKGAGLDVAVLENRARWVAPGLNACIRRARGDLVVRLDCHSRYPPDYVRACVTAAEETGAWNVGGIYVPEGETPAERAVSCALESPFGGVNWTRHGAEDGRVEVDTVYLGAFRPEALERVGLFDETFERNQDDELNLRLRLAGGRIVLDPAIRSRYRPRGSAGAVFRQYFEYGRWKVPVMLKHRQVVSARSLAPLALAASVAVLAAAAPASPLARRALAAELGLYGAAALGFGAVAVRRRGESWTLLPRVVASFGAFHAGYALGMARGWLGAVRR
jgi:succinoglycan biosynthesis protein ExoA